MAKQTIEDTVKPSNDAYTGMLAISLIALLIGGALLYLDLSQYGGIPPKRPPAAAKPKVTDAPTAAPTVAPSPSPSPSPSPKEDKKPT